MLCVLAGTLLPIMAHALNFDKAKKKHLDVRILVDVSSKMKLHDPENFRSSALELFVKLLPSNTVAGMWMYDGMVTELMPPSKVGISWKLLAQKATDKIHSEGAYSNLEKALAVASLDWVEQDKNTYRHIILLTDGLVNVGDKRESNEASVRRILGYQLNRLKELGVVIHAVGLSEKADISLLEELVVGTGGWYDRAKTASHLERTLYRVNRRLVQKNSIPIAANKFYIDDDIREFTAVVFRKKRFGSVQLDDPEGMDFGRESRRNGVTWHRAKTYDIVTVTNPIEGEWRLIASADPDNDILVSTNLQMVVDELPKEIPSGQDTRIRSLLVDRGKLITNGNFLDAVDLSLELKDKDGEVYTFDMQRDMITGGFYFADIGKNLIKGSYEMTVIAKGNTFQRIDSTVLNVGPKIRPKVVSVPPDFKRVLTESGLDLPANQVYDSKILIEFDAELAALQNGEQLFEPEVVEEESDWMMTAIIIALTNLLLAAAGFFGLKFYKKKMAASDELLISKLAA